MSHHTLLEQLDSVSDFPGGVQSLRDQIILLMLQGKLVHHDPEDGQAAELLERIRAAKGHNGNGHQVLDTQPPPAIVPEEMPFELPESWAWTRWGDVISELDSGSEGAAPGSLVIARKGAAETVGQSVLIEDASAATPSALPATECIRLRMPEELDARFFHIANNSIAGRSYYASLLQQNEGEAEIAPTAVTHMPFPIPPRGEQARLVARVEELLGLCDQLEERQRQRHETRQRELEQTAADLLTEAS